MPEIKAGEIESTASIKVIGVGGAGGSAVNRMQEAGLAGVELIAMNTDAQALHNSKADVKVHLGHETTNGLGAGADPVIGEKAAEESREEIRNALTGADMAFITLGAGGGTGSGAGYIVADEARKQGILAVGVVTKPFSFEGSKRATNADWAISRLTPNVDALITIPNDRLLESIDPNTSINQAFQIADSVLQEGVQGISDLITENSLINLDFADVKSIMKDAGSALMGIGRASGEDRARVAAQQAIDSPLIEVSIDGARGVLFSVAGGENVSMREMQEAADVITGSVSPDANIIWGASIRPELDDEVVVTVVATGFDSEYYRNDPRAQEVIAPTSSVDSAVKEESRAANDFSAASTSGFTSTSYDKVDEIVAPDTAASTDFASSTTQNMWDSIRPEASATSSSASAQTDSADIPAILRRRKKRG